ncbi:GNAT family N-acetyltransferase [Hydrogenovibrio kuenenii]|uniref:GNAT family N-acetyltransferase n=1 Tax=Hydrogenovibrio kuenenii TaxID=63658 RepID=UPI00046728AA|nr:GNAT family N-acetyltransferase [Hydrogenovibrio kuenenii]
MTSPMAPIHCQQAKDSTFLLGNRFLKQHGQATAGRADLLFTIHFEQTLIGATWLRPLDNYLWLRSLFIIPEYRHQGFASALLKHIQQSLGQTQKSSGIVCLVKPDLSDFYQHNSYLIAELASLPKAVQTTFEPYLRQHPAWQIFIYETSL